LTKEKYRFNPKTLSYEKVRTSVKVRIWRLLSYLFTGLVFAVSVLVFAYSSIDSPKEKILKRENEQLSLQYDFINKRLGEMESVLSDLQQRDDNIYRVIFEAEPIPENVRKAGVGGANRYQKLEGYESSDLIIETTSKLDKLAKQLYIQSKSFDEVFELAKQKEKLLASLPAIQPLSNKELTRVASGFGYRMDPIYKTKKFHTGMDFTAPTGTEIYATGNGKVEYIEKSFRGYGNHIIINHGFGYQTLYGHMSVINVRIGQEVKRGDVIGYVGNTGKSTGPHLHYEVIKNDEKINPVNFYFNDLTAEEYERMIHISSTANQAFD
jgi:murein DD-endopeptidase MepM/ murein hydrolase activator NlpD